MQIGLTPTKKYKSTEKMYRWIDYADAILTCIILMYIRVQMKRLESPRALITA